VSEGQTLFNVTPADAIRLHAREFDPVPPTA
jgi:hypothetical protein